MSEKKENRSLPEGWRWVKLGDVCQQDRKIIESNTDDVKKLTYYGLEHVETETGRLIKSPENHVESEGISTTFYFDERHVLYGKLRPYLNKVALPSAPGRCTTEIIPLLPTGPVEREFLVWLLRRHETVEFAMKGKTGSRMPRADMDYLMKLQVPIPSPDDQKRIVKDIKEKMAAIEKARAAAQARLEAAKALPGAYLREVFPAAGEKLPDGWRWVKLGEVIRDAQAGFACGQRDDLGVVQLRMNNLDTRGNFVWENVLRVPIQGNNIEKFLLEPGDVLFNNTNSTELVGKSAIFDTYIEPIVYSNHFTRLRTISTELSPAFLSLWLNHQWQKGVFAAICNRWIGQSAVKADKLLSLDFPLPPIEKQEQIAKVLLEKMARVEKTRTNALVELETINTLPAALLRRAFEGGL